MQQKLGTSIVLITHDLGVVAETAQRVVVMYAGRRSKKRPSRHSSMSRCIPTRSV
jgi:ABC-type dipeptide/oligopeptide/nickel transport system ATPase component